MARWEDSRPPYLQAAADMRAQIMAGDLVGDETGQIPTVKQLMDAYNTTSTSVIQRALAVLKDEGIIVTRHGKGSFVRTEQLLETEMTPGINLGDGEQKSKYELLEVGDAKPPADAARALGLRRGDEAALRKQVLIRPDGLREELTWNYYLVSDAHGTPLAVNKRIRGGAKAYLESVGRFQAAMENVITTRPPTAAEVEDLELPENVPILRTLRRIADQDGAPMEVSVIIKGGHLFALRNRIDLH
jgi:GntR family transcriptional regulator